jgi:hypothetical protein
MFEILGTDVSQKEEVMLRTNGGAVGLSLMVCALLLLTSAAAAPAVVVGPIDSGAWTTGESAAPTPQPASPITALVPAAWRPSAFSAADAVEGGRKLAEFERCETFAGSDGSLGQR